MALCNAAVDVRGAVREPSRSAAAAQPGQGFVELSVLWFARCSLVDNNCSLLAGARESFGCLTIEGESKDLPGSGSCNLGTQTLVQGTDGGGATVVPSALLCCASAGEDEIVSSGSLAPAAGLAPPKMSSHALKSASVSGGGV